MLKIQQDLLGNNAGIRSTPGTVLRNDQTGEIVYTPPQGKQEIENIITSTDELYEALSSNRKLLNNEVKEVVNYRRSIFLGFELLKSQGFLRVNDVIKYFRFQSYL